MSVVAVVPVKDLVAAKSRLTPVLTPEGRAGLTVYMMKNVLSALREAGVDRACVVSPDPIVLKLAEEAGATPLRQESRGLNPALDEARAWATSEGATSLLVLPADLPLLKAPDVEAILEAADGEGPRCVISPDATRSGTNALLLRPPDALPFLFGPNSFRAHLDAASERGVEARPRERPRLAFDLDTANDLARFGGPAGFSGTTPGPPPGARDPSEGLRVLPVPGIPEVRPGDDLPDVISVCADGLLRPGDIVVVTHKIVSKAEGRLVDLNTIQPSVLAKDFASRYDKDPRQVEVVLRESKRVVRMERGVIISETRHGFICANAGVDASNVPGEDVVCLLPLDPDAAAARIRDRLAASLGSDLLAVVVSDSFGRPWRYGITNVAIGVAGMDPLADYRGETDPYGYPLTTSVLAVADELAAAAELVMGKTSGVPVAAVRDYPYSTQPTGSGKDLLMPPKRDLFR